MSQSNHKKKQVKRYEISLNKNRGNKGKELRIKLLFLWNVVKQYYPIILLNNLSMLYLTDNILYTDIISIQC